MANKVSHYAKKGFHKHWWGAGWHTSCGMQLPYEKDMGFIAEGDDHPRTTKDKNHPNMCKRCSSGMDFACKKCHRNPCVCKEAE